MAPFCWVLSNSTATERERQLAVTAAEKAARDPSDSHDVLDVSFNFCQSAGVSDFGIIITCWLRVAFLT